jgi:hypothetical protein
MVNGNIIALTVETVDTVAVIVTPVEAINVIAHALMQGNGGCARMQKQDT